MKDCLCVFPGEGEEEMVTVEAGEGRAVRVYLQAGPGGYVRVQQMAHDERMGWYVQKSMVVERDVLEALLPVLRKGLCLMPKSGGGVGGETMRFPRLGEGVVARVG